MPSSHPLTALFISSMMDGRKLCYPSDKNKSTVYFQPAIPSVENWNKLLANSAKTKKRFENLLDELLNNSKPSSKKSYPRLEYNPIQNYETERLSFIKGGIGQIDIEAKDVIRCFNVVLYYFNNAFHEKALKWFANNTKEGGIVLVGGDWAASTECYYNVYKKIGDQLVNKEFAFSFDCICPFGIVTWYTSHNDNLQKAELVKHIGAIRKKQMPLWMRFILFMMHKEQNTRYARGTMKVIMALLTL